MKNITFTVFILLLSAASPAFSQEFFVARVLEVSSENLELVVISTKDTDSKVTVRIAGQNDLPRHEGQTFFPDCVAPGETIRLWGSNETTDDPYFLATDIRGCRKGGCSDPTGVRSRLRNIRKHEDRNSEGDGEQTGFGMQGMGGHGGAGGNGGGNGGGGGGNR